MNEKIKEKLKSIRVKLFVTLCIVVVIIIAFLIITNNFVLETFYLYSKQRNLMEVYHTINEYYTSQNSQVDLELEIEKLAINNNFDILIRTDTNISIYSTNKDFVSAMNSMNNLSVAGKKQEEVLYKKGKVTMKKLDDLKNGMTYIMFSGILNNGYILYIRLSIASIQESVSISNNFLYLIGGVTILIGGIVVSFISKRFTSPILELNDIAKSMSRLDFSKKYETTDTDDEINNLGRSINTMSEKLEKTIKQLRSTNLELEKDIEKKSKIDEMRKQFISDVSHELKTPIALIQGYAEGLLENVNTDEQNREFYSEVILDEANKMDKLVKELLELMKLEYGKREFNNTTFDIQELIAEVIKKSRVMLEENNIKVEFEVKEPIYVYADDFYIEQVVTNYLTNAIKNNEEQKGRKRICITIQPKVEINKVRISVFNTGKNLSEENMIRIWKRFYKADESRNRADGGTGIGLSLVKAIMNNYQNEYGVTNKEEGVEFYFELDLDLQGQDKIEEGKVKK